MNHELDYCYKTSQSLRGSRIVNTTYAPIRASIVRDAYEEQSYGLGEVWTTLGWSQVQRLPISDFPIHMHSWAAQDGTWESDMYFSLDDLIERVLTFLDNMNMKGMT